MPLPSRASVIRLFEVIGRRYETRLKYEMVVESGENESSRNIRSCNESHMTISKRRYAFGAIIHDKIATGFSHPLLLEMVMDS
jgi:hypothetical protein